MIGVMEQDSQQAKSSRVQSEHLLATVSQLSEEILGTLELDKVLETAVREMVEESAVQVAPADMHQMGQFTFFMPAKPEWNMEVHAFVATRWTGNPQTSPEMVPQWFTVADVPYTQLWADDAYWLPRVLAGEQLTGVFTFADDNVTLASWELNTTRF